MTHVLPVEGLFETREEGARAADALASRGLGEVTVRPLRDVNLGLLPTTEVESKRRLYRCLLAIPVGFVIGAPNGIAVFLLLGLIPGLVAAMLFGITAALIAFLLMDRPPLIYRQLAKKDGVLLTVTCPDDTCPQVMEVLRDQHPVELFGPKAR